MQKLTLLLVLALVAAACGDSSPTETGSDLPFGIERCASETVRVSAPEEFYRDEPVYAGNNPHVDDLRAWARGKPGFQDIWIDRDRNGWVSLAFSEDADLRQLELEEEFPDVGVVAVAVDWTDAELQEVRDEVFVALGESALENYGGGHSVSTGFVEIDLPVLDEATLEPLAPFADDRLCVSGLDPVDAVSVCPQPTEGAGWRLLGTERTAESYRTAIATTPEQYSEVWATAGLTADQPSVDFVNEVVIWFGAVYGSGCEIRMDDVVFDQSEQLVHGNFVIPGSPVFCDDDANPEAYVVAVERSMLPAAPFAIQLRATDPPSGVPEERTLVSIDLREPRSAANSDEVGTDPALTEQIDRGYVVTAGGVMEVGYPATYDLDLSCEFAMIGPLNGIVWQADNDELSQAEPPRAWTDAADDGIVEIELFMSDEPATLTLAAGGHTESYAPASPGTTSNCE